VISLLAQSTLSTLSVRVQSPGSIRISWADPSGDYALEGSAMLGTSALWEAVTTAPSTDGAQRFIDVPAGNRTRFFRLRNSNVPLGIAETSPASGESGVAPTRETIFRFKDPLAADTVLTIAKISAEFGGRLLLARPELSSDRRTVTLFYLENLPASARVRVTLDGDALRDEKGKAIDGNGDGLPGGLHVLEFDTGSITALGNTAVIGRVFASEKNPDGSNRPLENVTITVDGAEEILRTTTDSDGAFKLQPAPAGRFFVHVDGRTALGSLWPGGAYYPFVGKAWEAVPGRTNNFAGGSGVIYLPLIQSDALKPVSATVETKITFSPSVLAANPALTGAEVLVPANALFSENGARGGQVGIAPVPPDRLPEPLPPGLNLPVVVTIQTDGPQNFDRPVPLRLPNLPEPQSGRKLGAGEKTVLWSFNHDTGRWEPQGIATVTPDGNFIETDPGVGVRQPGWHGFAPGNRGRGPSNNDRDRSNGGCPGCEEPPEKCYKRVPCGKPRGYLECTFECMAEPMGQFYCKINPWDPLCDGVTPPPDDPLALGLCGGSYICTDQTSNTQDMMESDQYDDMLSKDARNCMDQCMNPPTTITRCESPNPCGDFEADSVHAHTVVVDPSSVPEDWLHEQWALWQSHGELLRLIFGTEKILQTPFEEVPRWAAFRGAVSERSKPASPSGARFSAQEKAELLALPRLSQFTPGEWEALVNRIDLMLGNALPQNQWPALELIQAGQTAKAVREELVSRGWKHRLDGLRVGLTVQSRVLAPELGSELFPKRAHFYLLRNLANGFEQRGRLNANGQFEALILPDATTLLIGYVDPVTGHAGAAFFRSGENGQESIVPTAPLEPTEGPDTDGDGFADTVEAILGTNPNAVDSDGDGIGDAAELLDGGDPLSDIPAATGLIGGVDTPGNALAVHASSNFAFVADSEAGLAVINISQASSPVLAAQLPIPNTSSESIAGAGGYLAVGGSKGLALVDARVPSAPELLRFLPIKAGGGRVNAVAARPGQVGAAYSNGDLVLYESETGEVQQRFDKLDSSLHDLQFSGSRLFVLSQDELIALEWLDSTWILAGRIPAPGNASPLEIGRKLAVSGSTAWVGYFTGYSAFEVSNPSVLTILGQPPATQAAVHDLVPTGSGRLAITSSFGGQGSLAVSLYDVSQPQFVNRFLTSFQTAGNERALAMHRGRILVAAEQAGLQIVNVVPSGLGTNPPAVSILPQFRGSREAGEFGADLQVSLNALDDVGIRSVELEMDGQIIRQFDSVPFDAGVPMAAKASGKSNVVLRARAVNLAGLATWSTPLSLPLVDDATAPQLVSTEPVPGTQIAPGSIDQIRIAFAEPVVSAVNDATLTLFEAGADRVIGTADDVPIQGSVSYEAASRTLVFQAPSVFTDGRYRAVLAAGVADAAGNSRTKPVVLVFETGPLPQIIDLFPPNNLVRVGETLKELFFTFDRPVLKKIADTYVWNITRRDLSDALNPPGPAVPFTAYTILRSADQLTFTFRADTTFPPGTYVVTGSGPFVNDMHWEFHFRDVPNEALRGGNFTSWRYSPGVGIGDELIVNLPGEITSIQERDFRSLTAYTDIRLFRTTVQVSTPIDARAGLDIVNTRFGPGETHVRGPLAVYDTFTDPTSVGAHTLNLYGGGYIRTAISLHHPAGAIVNHPGSSLVLSNFARIDSGGLITSNAGSFVNLGVLRSVGEQMAFDVVRLRNDGQIQVPTGLFTTDNLENQGVIDVSIGARLSLIRRIRSGIGSSIEGGGTVEFGAIAQGRRINADAELRGDLRVTGSIRAISGSVDLWRPLAQPSTLLEISNAAALRLRAPSQLGTLIMGGGTLALNADSQIASIITGSADSKIDPSGLTRVLGEAGLRGLSFEAPGTMVFEGQTTLSNGNSAVGLRFGHTVVRNTGRWMLASSNNNQGTEFTRRAVNGQPGLGAFENAGRLEHAIPRPILFQVPFRNAGLAILSNAMVTFDKRNGTYSGAYLPQPGAELVLNGTQLEHGEAGTLDLAAGIVRGTGRIRVLIEGGKIINRAVLRPGNPTGDLTVRANGGFEQTATGELAVTLAAAGNSRLAVDGTPATLAGRLRVELAEGFSPTIGAAFTILNSSSRTGEFSEALLPSLGAGKQLAVTYSATSVTLSVVAGP